MLLNQARNRATLNIDVAAFHQANELLLAEPNGLAYEPSIQYEVCLHAGTDSPADDPSRKHVNHEGHIQSALPGRLVRARRRISLAVRS